jgi:hypothetical protein
VWLYIFYLQVCGVQFIILLSWGYIIHVLTSFRTVQRGLHIHYQNFEAGTIDPSYYDRKNFRLWDSLGRYHMLWKNKEENKHSNKDEMVKKGNASPWDVGKLYPLWM